MSDHDEKVRAVIAEQAGGWLVTNDEGPLDARESERLASWLKASPVHVEEFLGVSVVAGGLRALSADPEYSVDAVLARARAADDTTVQYPWPRAIAAVTRIPARRWKTAAVMVVGFAVSSLGLFLWWNPKPTSSVAAAGDTTALHFETRHGEQLIRRLADHSVLHLNTDSGVTIQYGSAERRVTLTSGQADFEVAHEPHRAFRVFAGMVEVVAIGTNFDVRLEDDATVVTVVEGRVAVGPSAVSEKRGANSNANHPPRIIELGADQQLRLVAGEWPPAPVAVDSQRATAWLHRQISFDHEPLERVAAEYNRYAAKPIEITSPALRTLQISGVFATDDPAEFIAFLRSLKGVRVEVTATQIRVSAD